MRLKYTALLGLCVLLMPVVMLSAFVGIWSGSGNKALRMLIALDQLGNTALNGEPDETLSARAYRSNSRLRHFINWLFSDPSHCFEAYMAELNRTQLPRAYSLRASMPER